MFSQLLEVGVKCSWNRGRRASQDFTLGWSVRSPGYWENDDFRARMTRIRSGIGPDLVL